MKATILVLTALLSAAAAQPARAQCCTGSPGDAGPQHRHGTTGRTDTKDHHPPSTASMVQAVVNEHGEQEATILVKDGYRPEVVVAKKGIPLHLKFDLQEEGCTARVVFRDLGIDKLLSPFKTTTLTFTPEKTGEFPFACPMNMIHGVLVVKE